MLVSTSCAFTFISIVQEGIENRFVKVKHILKLFIFLLVCRARGILGLFGGLKCSLKECRDPKFLVHYFLLDII